MTREEAAQIAIQYINRPDAEREGRRKNHEKRSLISSLLTKPLWEHRLMGATLVDGEWAVSFSTHRTDSPGSGTPRIVIVDPVKRRARFLDAL